jgi:hypothetical protein
MCTNGVVLTHEGGKVRDCTGDRVAVVQFVFYQDFVVALSLDLKVLCSVGCCVCALNSHNKKIG